MNLNDKVYFRMTPAGRDIVRKSIGKLTVLSDLKIDERGFSAWLLWHVMVVFGPYMSIGFNGQVIENNQILSEEEYQPCARMIT